MLQAFICCLLALAVLVGCTAQSTQEQLAQQGFAAEVVQGEGFLHLVIPNSGSGSVLHVYLEGDGRPWLQRDRVSLDPTPKRAVMLELFSLDPGPAIYLGRPCYWRLDDPLCTPRWWTSARYSEQVVSSLNTVISDFATGYGGIVLIGHSGGGALAMLLAAQRGDVRSVITLAGNLDIDAWAQAHGYTSLSDSLNPALQPPLPANIRQYHLLGARDRIITADMASPTIARQTEARLIELETFDHSCCWADIWVDFLANPDAGLD